MNADKIKEDLARKIKEDLKRKRQERLATQAAASGERPPAVKERQRPLPLTAEEARQFGIEEEHIPKEEASPPMRDRRDAETAAERAMNNGEIFRPGVSFPFINRNNIRHVDKEQAEALTGFKASGIYIPYPGLNSPQMIVHDRPFGRLRPYHPLNGHKYLSPQGSGAQLYIPGGALFGKELVICEGEFKTLALCEADIRAVGIGGIQSAMTEGEPIPDLKRILRKYNPSTIYFLGDSDTSLIFDFSREAVKLAKAVAPATLKVPRIPLSKPKGIDNVKEALGDDFLDFWRRITTEAIEVGTKLSPDALAVELLASELPYIAQAANKPELESRIVELASYLDELHLDKLAAKIKEHLDLSVVSFRHTAQARAKRRAEDYASKAREAKLLATPDSGRPGDNLAGCELPGDAGRAKLFIDRNGEDLRFVHVWDSWLIHRRNRWRIDHTGEITRCSLATGSAIMGEAFAVTGEAERQRAIREAAEWGNTTKISSMLTLAKDDLRVVLDHQEVDADPWMLGTRNGVIDLRSGQLVESAGYITKSIAVPFDPSARCPRWEQFLGEVFPEPSIREYVRHVIGYTLAGITDEHLFMFCYGTGANGKSTLLETLQHVMGDYGSRAGSDIICLPKHGREPEGQIAELVGQRLVIGAETAEGARLNENLIKDITGGDTLRGRRLYESAFQFIPQCTLWLFGNHKPAISGCDDGIWRRVRLIPFLQKFEGDQKDPSLKTKLRAEAQGILAWAVRACLDWQSNELTTPDTVRLAVEEYRTDEDILADFIEECTETLLGFSANHAELFRLYKQWADRNGIRYLLTRKGLAKRLRDRDWHSKPTNHGIEWLGRKLRPTE